MSGVGMSRVGAREALVHNRGEGLRSHTQTSCTSYQRTQITMQLGQLPGRIRDDGPAPAAQVNQPLVAQLLVGAQHGVHVDAEAGGDLSGGRQDGTGDDPTGHRIGPHGASDLLIDGALARGINPNQHRTPFPKHYLL